MPRYSLPQENPADSGFQTRDLIRFFLVDIILIVLLRLLLAIGFFAEVDHYVLAILGSKVVLFLYLAWLIRDRRNAWPETGIANAGRWWAWPVSIVAYAAFYPILLYCNSLNRILMVRLHDALGWVYTPQPQDVMVLIFEDILQTPVRVLLIFFTVIAGPFMEELAFRGVGLDAYRRTVGVFWALVWTGLLFGLYHFSLELLLPLGFLGVFFGAVRLVTGSLWCGVLVHCLHNAVTLLIMAHGLGVLETLKFW
ncbi:MAG: CPBP family intramembrane metalloprotease [Planctomycetaceae bacterium]|nr:CPBP family intramembrane metalloprotease [Planctomycetaceae bacterium]